MRRYSIIILLIVIMLGFGTYMVVEKDENVTSMAMYQGNSQHTGDYETRGVKNFQKVKWKFKTEGSINTAPIVDNNFAYIGSDDDSLYAIDIESGKKVWSFKTQGDIRSTPCVLEEFIFLASEDGKLYALDKNTGEEKWNFSSGERIHKNDKNDVIIASSPTAENDTVYFGSYDGYMYALDVGKGEIKWKFKTEASVKSSPALYKGRVYFGSFDGYMYCLSSKNGDLKWKYKAKTHWQCPYGQIYSSPMINEGVVYFGGVDFHIYALDSKTGKEKWVEYAADQPIYSTLAFKEDTIYYGTVGWHNPRVYARDLNGKNKWKFQIRDRGIKDSKGNVNIGSWMNDNHMFTASPIIAGELLYIGSWDKNLYAIDRYTGEMKWKFATKGPIGASATVKDGIVYVGSYDGYIYALSD